MRKKKRILFVISSLEAGGTERFLVTLLKYLDRYKFQPLLAVLKKIGPFLTEIPSDVPIYNLQRGKYWNTIAPIFRLMDILRKKEVDLIVSLLFPANVASILAKSWTSTKIKLIICERSAYLRGIQGERLTFLRKAILRYLNPKADRILAVSQGIQQILEEDYRIPPNEVKVIYNLIDINRVKNMSREPITNPWSQENMPILIAVGRLVEAKGFTYLLKAFAIVTKNIPARLVILGDGPDRKKLEKLAIDLEIFGDMSLLGFQDNPFKYMSKATIFILSSVYEGFPMVLLEAMACGVPVIATRCESGPEEIIEDGKSGILVPVANEQALAEAIIRLLKDTILQKKMAKVGDLRVQDFAAEKIVKEYEHLFQGILFHNSYID